MNWEAVGAISELIGGLAVIISLIYLAIQIKQNSDSTKALIRQEIADSILNNITGAVQSNDRLQEVMRKALNGTELNEEEQFRWTVYLYNTLRVHDTAFKQYKSGFLPEEEWKLLLKNLTGYFDESAFPSTAKLSLEQWERNRIYTEGFHREVDSALETQKNVRDRDGDTYQTVQW